MADGIEAFKVFNEAINRNIFADPNFAAAEASGNTRRSLLDEKNLTIRPNHFIKRAVGYWRAIDEGRGENQRRSGGLVSGIYDWLEFRKYGFEWKDHKQRLGMAIAIARKTAKYGSAKYRKQVPRTTIFASAVNSAVPALLKSLVTQRTIEMTGAIKKSF